MSARSLRQPGPIAPSQPCTAASARPGAVLRVVAPDNRVPHAFAKLALLSLALHGLLLTGAWLWPTTPAETPIRPEPVTLVSLAAAPPVPASPAARPEPVQSPPEPTPAPPKPAAAPKPEVALERKPAPPPKPAPRRTTPSTTALAVEPVRAAPSPAAHSPAAPTEPAITRAAAPQAPGAVEQAPIAIDLNAAYRLNPAPNYPPLALRRRWEGTTRLRVELDSEGRPITVTLADSSGHAILDEAALEAVRRWRFRPATRSGKPVPATVEVPIVFRISR